MRYLAGAMVLIAGWSLLGLVISFDADDDALSVAAVAGPSIAAGALVGRWPAVGLALVPLAAAIPYAFLGEHEDLSDGGLIALVAAITVPLCAAAIGAGVALRKFLERVV